jgi:hypothetical protein
VAAISLSAGSGAATRGAGCWADLLWVRNVRAAPLHQRRHAVAGRTETALALEDRIDATAGRCRWTLPLAHQSLDPCFQTLDGAVELVQRRLAAMGWGI